MNKDYLIVGMVINEAFQEWGNIYSDYEERLTRINDHSEWLEPYRGFEFEYCYYLNKKENKVSILTAHIVDIPN